MKTIFSKKFIKLFIISFFIYLSLLLLHVISKYSPDIFLKGFSVGIILRFIFFTALTLVGLSFPFGFLSATILTVKHYSNNYDINIIKEIINGTFITIIFSLLLVCYNNWVLPKANLEMRTMLFNMQGAAPGDDIDYIDKSLFRNNEATVSIIRLNRKLKNIENEIVSNKYQLDSILLIMPEKHAIDQFNKLQLNRDNVQLPSKHSSNDLSDMELEMLDFQLHSFSMNLRQSLNQKEVIVKEISSRIIVPFELILLFILGAYLGFYYKDQRSFMLILAGLSAMSILLGTKQIFEYLTKLNIFGYVSSVFISIYLFIAIAVVFFRVSYKKDKLKNSSS